MCTVNVNIDLAKCSKKLHIASSSIPLPITTSVRYLLIKKFPTRNFEIRCPCIYIRFIIIETIIHVIRYNSLTCACINCR